MDLTRNIMGEDNGPADSIEICKKKFSCLKSICDSMTSKDIIKSISDLMLGLALDFTNAEKASLMTLNEDGELSVRAAKGTDMDKFHNSSIRIGEGIAGRIAEQKKPALVRDIDKDERFRAMKRDHYKSKSFISCPVIYNNRVLGIFNLNDKKDGSEFTVKDLALMKVVSSQASLILENTFIVSGLRAEAAGLQEINKNLIGFDILKTEFFTRISHDLRTPLNAIKGSIYYLNKTLDPVSDQQREFCNIISAETNKLISISENLLDFLRFGCQPQPHNMKKAPFSLPALVKEVIDSLSLKSVLKEKRIELQIESCGALLNISAERTRTFQFFSNLIEGLGHFLETGDKIAISFSESDFVNLHIAVPKQLPEPIYQKIWNSPYIQGGTGERLKLYLAWKIAEIHQWKLFTENRADRFCISVSIPKWQKRKPEPGSEDYSRSYAGLSPDF